MVWSSDLVREKTFGTLEALQLIELLGEYIVKHDSIEWLCHTIYHPGHVNGSIILINSMFPASVVVGPPRV